MLDPLSVRTNATPDRTALVDAQSGETWRYDELAAEAEELARRLASLGVEPGDRIGLLAPTSTIAIRAVHAVFRLGATLVPLNVRLPARELEGRLDRTDVGVLLCTEATAESASAIDGVQVVSLDGGTEQVEADLEDGPLDWPSWELDDTLLILFTSGTTGEPKAVPLTSRNGLASAAASACRLGVLPGDRWLLCLPIYHMGGLAPVLRSTMYGTTVVVHEGFEAGSVAMASREHEVTGVSLVPTQLRRIFEADEPLADSLRFVLLGGAPASPDLVAECEERDVPVHPTYGTTETASQVATATPAQAFAHEGTVGQPLVGTTVRIVDDDGTSVPPGEEGEIVVSGPTVTPGYLGIAADEIHGEGFHTGDLGYRDEAGRLWVTGRLDDLIVTGGENVSPRTVETALREHPSVREAAVVGLPDPEWGERVGALVVSQDPLDLEEVRSFCRERLADYAIPKTIGSAPELPRTASGTVDREALRDRLRDD